METIIKTVSKGATKLLQEGVGVTIPLDRNLLSLTELIFCLSDLSFLVLKYLFQLFNACLRLLQQLLAIVQLVNLDVLLGR